MSTTSPTLPFVLAFAQEMEKQLVSAGEADKEGGWMKQDPHDLYAQALGHLRGLEVELLSRDVGRVNPDAIAHRCAAVANFAMMVADVCGVLPAPADTGGEPLVNAHAVEMLEQERAARDASDANE